MVTMNGLPVELGLKAAVSFNLCAVAVAILSGVLAPRLGTRLLMTVATVVTTLLIPLMGALSDRIGRKTVYIAGVLMMMAYAFPYFWLLQTRSFSMLILATVIGLGVIWAPTTAVLGTMFSEIFKSNVRYTGITLGYQIGAALAGGTAPLVATFLLAKFDHSYVPIALYIIFTGLVSLVAIAAVSERSGRQLDE